VKGVYGVTRNTYCPSVFGKNNILWNKGEGIRIENRDDYFNTITKEIKRHINDDKAVLVFFETMKNLIEYRDSIATQTIKDIKIVTEEVTPEEKEMLIKRATFSKSVTLFTRMFGRGTDFVCNDQRVISKGGVHVLMTFLSLELSEETQIRGRTGRQGADGTFSMILLDAKLERFGITDQDIKNLANMDGEKKYKFLDDKRQACFTEKYKGREEKVEKAEEEHIESMKFLSALRQNDVGFVKEFLEKHNKGAELVEAQAVSKTLVLMDATGSMDSLLDKAKSTVHDVFQRAQNMLANNAPFLIQFAVYRNYNVDHSLLLQHSPWESKAENIKKFMDCIRTDGGLGNEAIEIGFQHANKEAENGLSQIILIGDAAANTKQEVMANRKYNDKYNEEYWKKHWGDATHYSEELGKLKDKGIKVHTFYLANRARQNFEEIANESGGKSQALDVNGKQGSEMLAEILTCSVLVDVAGEVEGQKLVEKYKKTYKK